MPWRSARRSDESEQRSDEASGTSRRQAAEADQDLAALDIGTAEHAVRELGGRFGNAAVASALRAREQVQAVTGFDLSGADVHVGSDLPARVGVDGLTVGNDVHLAPGISPESEHGRHVLAHEYAHVVQQAAGSDVPRHDRRFEADAERVATQHTADQPAALAPLPSPRGATVQLFDPRYHRTSIVRGLEGSGFTPDEVGRIYAANWERDLSQAAPQLGAVILTWKAVKVAAYEQRLTEGELSAFQGACQSALDGAMAHPLGFAHAHSYGGYQFYEHMDKPEADTPEAARLSLVMGGRNHSGLPDHIYVTLEYIKEMLFEASALSHPDLGGDMASAKVANNSAATRMALGADSAEVLPGGLPTTAMAAETSHEVRSADPSVPGGGAALDPRAYDLIGRASHALEDFWSHSNFVEIAIGDPEYQLNGLTTATFGKDDSAHAIAHKIRALADEIEAEMPLIDRMALRRYDDIEPSEVHIGDEDPVRHEDAVIDGARAAAALPEVVAGLPGNQLAGAFRGARAGGRAGVLGRMRGIVEGQIIGGTLSVLGSRAGVFLLRQIAEHKDEATTKMQEEKGDFGAHGLLAKDQPGHDDDAAGALKTAKFELAHALSVASDRMVTARLKAVAEAPDGAAADALLQQIFADLDRLIAGPNPGHPLWSIVEAHRASAEEALNTAVWTKPFR